MLRALLDLLFPPLCHSCKAFIPKAGTLHLCPSCLGKTSFIGSPCCPVCGIPYPRESGSDHICGACRSHPPFDGCRSAVLFAGPLQELIHRFKYNGQVHLARPLGILLAQSLRPYSRVVQPDVILPVPLHRKRLRQRGYNQSQLIGKVLGKEWKVPMTLGNLRRVRWTEPQIGLSGAERRSNVEGAFGVRDPAKVKGKRVLLVDDVLTTGSTMRACAEVLYEAEVEAVYAVTVARGIPP